MEYDTSLQDVIEQYSRSHELIEASPSAPTVHSCALQNHSLQSSVIVHSHLQIPAAQHTHLQSAVLIHNNVGIAPSSIENRAAKHSRSEDSNAAITASEEKKIRKRKVITKKTIRRTKVRINNSVRYKNKVRRELGQEYEAKVKVNDRWENISKDGKKLKSRCNCAPSKKTTKIQCETVTDEEREKIFNSFWKLSWKEKRLYIQMLVNIKPVGRRRIKEASRRANTLELHLKCKDRYVRVCKKMFLRTLCMTDWALKNWIHV